MPTTGSPPITHLVWHCSHCSSAYIAPEPATAYAAGFGSGDQWWTTRPAATPGAMIDPRRWRRVGTRRLYCPACWASGIDRQHLDATTHMAFGEYHLADGYLVCVCGGDSFFAAQPTSQPRTFISDPRDRGQTAAADTTHVGCIHCGAVYRAIPPSDSDTVIAAPVLGTATPHET